MIYDRDAEQMEDFLHQERELFEHAKKNGLLLTQGEMRNLLARRAALARDRRWDSPPLTGFGEIS